jgi:hypothetical protein
MKILFLSVLVSFTALGSTQKYEVCEPSTEYIKTLNFLRAHSEFGVSDKDAQKLSFEIAKNCNNASTRFLKIITLLSKVGIDTQTSIKYAKLASSKTDTQAEAFVKFYKDSFKESIYDLDAQTALEYASSLSLNYEGNVEVALQDFLALRDYCMSNNGPNLDMRKCSEMSVFVSKHSEHFNRPLHEPFIELLKYLTGELGVTIKDAVDIAKKVIINGPSSTQNFKRAYEFAASKKGLKRTAKQALQFALELTVYSNKEISSDKKP